MNWVRTKRLDDFSGRPPLAARVAGHGRNFTPSAIEARHPHRYARNVRLGLRLRSEGYTMLSQRRARALMEMSRYVRRKGIPGDMVDCGVWNGGSSIMLGLCAPDRQVWAFDSFAGLPKPGERDADADDEWEGTVVGSEKKLAAGFAEYAGGTDRLHVVKGWFHETFPQVVQQIDEIAVLHIDADFHDPCRLVLDTFYDKVSPGGFVAVDDLRMWQGAQIATNEFRADRGITAPIHANYYWQKPG